MDTKLEVAGCSVSTLLHVPDNCDLLLVMGHGAGAGMTHSWMDAMCASLAKEQIGTLRYNFPYMEQKRGMPDKKPVLIETVRAAVQLARAQGLPIIAGGKSMGGRMTSLAQSEKPLEGVLGLVFFGFPLHPAGKPSAERAEHLKDVSIPTLFLQGTRDPLADLDLLKAVLPAKSTIHVVNTADHSFNVLKSEGKSKADVLAELAKCVRLWGNTLL